MENKKYDEFISKYDIRVNVLNGVDILVAHKKEIAEDPDAMAFLKNNKSEILAQIKEARERKASEARERKAKIEAIEGLKEIGRLEADWRNYHIDLKKGIRTVAPPEITVAELCKRYPRASAYRKAESYKNTPNHKRAAAGAKAMERIINGEDCEAVIIEMINEVESPSAYGLAWV